MLHGLTRDEHGLTLMELIIVMAVIAIIGAILAPNFMSATDRARLKSDIQSAGVIQTAIETYNAEQSKAIEPAADVSNIMNKLIEKGYLSAASRLTTQTDSSFWTYSTEGVVMLNIEKCTDKVKGEIYNSLSREEKALVAGGIDK